MSFKGGKGERADEDVQARFGRVQRQRRSTLRTHIEASSRHISSSDADM